MSMKNDYYFFFLKYISIVNEVKYKKSEMMIKRKTSAQYSIMHNSPALLKQKNFNRIISYKIVYIDLS